MGLHLGLITITILLTFCALSLMASSETVEEKIAVYYPCTKCHPPVVTNATSSSLHMKNLTETLHRGLYCYTCHNPEDVLTLKSPNGTIIQLYPWRKGQEIPLCANCHGEVVRSYLMNLHGNLTGSWRSYEHPTSCVDCHDPHDPTFKALSPYPPPYPPPPPIQPFGVVLAAYAFITVGIAYIVAILSVGRRKPIEYHVPCKRPELFKPAISTAGHSGGGHERE